MNNSRKEILHDYIDVDLWFMKLGINDPLYMQTIINEALSITSKQFNSSLDYMKSLVGGTQFKYSKDEEPLVRFYYEYLRKIRDSHQ